MNDILFFVLVAKELQFTFKKRISGKLEIPVESLGVLMAIRHKASMIQQEIADTLKKDKSAILRHINLFESQGLITRSNTANDKRMNVIQITERGRQLLVSADAELDSLSNFLFDGVSKSDLDIYGKVLTHLKNKIEAISQKNNKMTARPFVSLATFATFLCLAVSGVALQMTNHQPYTPEKVFFTVLHNVSAIFFLVFSILHILKNWRAIRAYIKGKAAGKISREFIVCCILLLVLLIVCWLKTAYDTRYTYITTNNQNTP